jgi:hypothetical protein
MEFHATISNWAYKLCSELTMLDVAMDLLHIKFIHATKVHDATNQQH